MKSIIAAAASAWTSAGPFKATLAVTYRCPCRCAHCGVFTRKEQELDTTSLVSAIAPLQSIVWLDVTGGEVLLREDICELSTRLVQTLRNLAFFHFPTSGLMPEKAERLARSTAELGVRTFVSVSIDGPEDLHDRLRGFPGAFSLAVETIDRLRRLTGVETFVGTTILPENCHLIPRGVFEAVRHRVPALSPRDLHVNVMQRSGHYFSNAALPLPDVRTTIEALRGTMLWRGLPVSPFGALELGFQALSLCFLSGRRRLLPTCAALKSSFFMSPSGTVYPCHIWQESVGVAGEGGDVAGILAGDRARFIRKCIESRECPTCWTPCEAYPSMIAWLRGSSFRR